MKKQLVAIAFGTLCATSFAQTPSTYLCVADKATGFGFDKTTKQWSSRNFRTEGKYVISRSKQVGAAWEVKAVGEKQAYIICESDFNSVGNLFCQGLGTEFRFSNGSLRYMNTYLLGYWSDANVKDATFFEEGANTPSIEIGKCSPM